jgi:hypothetical protein
MKVKFYLLPLLLLLFIKSKAQDCSALTVSFSTTESRCVSTGSITVNVSGGSGNYNFKAVGPITTPTTSSNIITGLSTGYYTILVKDLTTGCIKTVDSAFVAGSYSDPRFQLVKTDASCALNDGTVSVSNKQFGRSPFSYTIVAPSPSKVGTTNTTGLFTGLIPGEYSIQLQDSCGGIQVRKITIENYSWWFDNLIVTRIGCDSAAVEVKLKDNKGNVNTSGTAFNNFTYGYVLAPGDTTWTTASSFHLLSGNRRSLVIVVKDACGKLQATTWFLPSNLKPSLSSVSLTNMACSTFTANVTGTNFLSPVYCLYDNNNNLITCASGGSYPNLAYGSYCIKVTDACYDTIITRCFTAAPPVPSVAPDVTISNRNCTTFTATITGQQNLYTPSYCLYDATNTLINCNSTGIFTNLPYGNYCIDTRDGCTNLVIKRCFTAIKPKGVLTGYTLTGVNCTGFNITANGDSLIVPQFCLYDSLGNVVDCNSSGIFNGVPHGHYCIRAISCGDTTNSICFDSPRPVPAVGGVVITNKNCSGFSASISGQVNLNNPDYCIYDNNNTLIGCNTTGIFDGLAYGSYCIKIHNNCYDTTITRCFTQLQDRPSINVTLQQLSTTCSTVSFKASGTNLVNPQFCLFDSGNNLVECNSTGIFNNKPYGQYCVVVHDGCIDTTMTVCQAFNPVRGISLYASKSCSIGVTNVDVQFASGSGPYSINFYHPNGALVYSTSTSSNPVRIPMNALPVGTQYKVVGTDNCGNKDSAFITPDANLVNKSVVVRPKCPSAAWLNGAGDFVITTGSNFFPVIPAIIKKNGINFNQGYSSASGTVYTFSDLEPATYIIEYTQQSCNGKIYDTVAVPPYAYPSQGQSAIYQCDNNSFSLGADVKGGVSPYSFQIIGSLPEIPRIISQAQPSPVFNINTGTTYSLVRLRTVDACGNATLSDVSVLPLQNISVTATNKCFYQNVLLSVDTIPNATYTWYRKFAGDSTVIGSGLTYNLPFFVPEEIGSYICKVTVNNGCATRLSSFTLDGNCGQIFLPLSFRLEGKKTEAGNQLTWTQSEEKGLLHYVLERKMDDGQFIAIATIEAQNKNAYSFNDYSPSAGINQYRLKLVYADKAAYSNIVILKSNTGQITVYPNPVKDAVHISFSTSRPGNYHVELVSSSGQVLYKTDIRNSSATTIHYMRTKSSPPGIYLVRITDIDEGTTETRKLLFE